MTNSTSESERTPLLGPRETTDAPSGLNPDLDSEAHDNASSSPPARTPLPWNQLIILLALVFVQPMAYEVIFPFISEFYSVEPGAPY